MISLSRDLLPLFHNVEEAMAIQPPCNNSAWVVPRQKLPKNVSFLTSRSAFACALFDDNGNRRMG